MNVKTAPIPAVRALPESVANRIAAGEVVERPASVVKELVENALDARATRIQVRIVAAGRRTIEIIDNGHGMSEQDALLAIERHTTSKIRRAEDLDNILTMGFRGEALASIAAVSRFELVTRRERDDSASRIRVEGGVLRDVEQVAAPVGTRISVNRLYFNTPVRAKFLKGITTELSQCIDVVQRHALAQSGIGFHLTHNDKTLIDIPEGASMRERIALIWGLSFLKDMIAIDGEQAGYRIHGFIGTPALSRSQRSHQYFFLNRRPVVNRSLQYGFEDGYRSLLTIGRHPVGILNIETHPRLVDVNIHPAKREIRFRDERVARDAIRDIVRARLEEIAEPLPSPAVVPVRSPAVFTSPQERSFAPSFEAHESGMEDALDLAGKKPDGIFVYSPQAEEIEATASTPAPVQTEFSPPEAVPGKVEPSAVYRAMGRVDDAPMQLFDTYLLVPEDDRLLIIDQHALHERLRYDHLYADLEDHDYQAQQLAVPLLVEVPPSHQKLLDANLEIFRRIGIEIEPFGGSTYQVTAICHLYEDGRVPDAIYRVLDHLAQGELFSREDFLADALRLTVEACRGSVKAGDRLSTQERRELLDGFQRLRPPYTCPHGRPIITELTQIQMEKSFRRRQ
ncbi:MAG TPA: DNA mismatch repair endonuclease MutL [Candidatus Hydrogenedentes bacterium]|nr:DNA mismatch repair endonuclease MutL [Candidatus Hydrogenedentota bacterium]